MTKTPTTPTVQDLHDLLSTLESDDDDERARILRRAQRAATHPGVLPTTELAAALAGQELGPVLAGDAISHVRSWLTTKSSVAPMAKTKPRLVVSAQPPRAADRAWRKNKAGDA